MTLAKKILEGTARRADKGRLGETSLPQFGETSLPLFGEAFLPRRSFALLLITMLLGPACFAQGEPVSWQLLTGAAVDSSGVFLHAVLNKPTSTVPLLRLAPAPRWGQTNFLTRQQVIELARRDFPALDTTTWTGPEQIRLERRSRQLLDFQLVDLLTAALQKQYNMGGGELDLRLVHPWTAVVVPEEQLDLRLTELPGAGLLPTTTIGFEIWTGKEYVGAWRIGVQAKLWRETPVARSPLSRGQLVRDADIALERRDVLARHEAYINLANAESLELSENIQPGQPILQHCVRARPIVRRGQVVDAIYQEGSLRITLKVETLDDGALGQMIRVRNPRTHRDLVAKVQNEQTVFIAL